MSCLLYSNVNQLQACTCPLPLDLLPTLTPALGDRSAQAELPMPCSSAHQLSALHMAVYIGHCSSQFTPCVCSLRLTLCSRPADGFIHTISLDSICIR